MTMYQTRFDEGLERSFATLAASMLSVWSETIIAEYSGSIPQRRFPKYIR